MVLVITGVGLAGWRTGSPVAWVALGLLAALTGWLGWLEVRERGRPGAAWVALGSTWLASLALAWFAERTGVL